ncbi:MAG: phosphoglycerate dehydrogenase [bacterium]
MPRILIADAVSEEGAKVLSSPPGFEVDNKPTITPEELLKTIGDYDALVVRSRTKVTADVLKAGKKLKVVGRAGVGLDNVDIETATHQGIIVMNTPGGNTISTAEHSFAMICSLARNIAQADASVKAGKWEKKAFTGIELNGKTLGVVGLGRIGREVARRAIAFHMRVLGYDPYVMPESVAKDGIECSELDTLFRESDFITVHTPVTSETRSLINKETLAKMKKGVRLINCARGGIIDETDLVEALKSGKAAGAALDVFEKEPLAADHPLRQCPNVILTPHLGASTAEAQENVAVEVAEQIVEALQGKRVRNAANYPSIDPEMLQLLLPYLNLAERLGKFLAQYVEGRTAKIAVEYSGTVLDFDVSPLTTSVIKGFLEPYVSEPINFVNALPRARSQGIEVVESKSSLLYHYVNLITVTTTTEGGRRDSVSGTLFAPTMPRIVVINGKHFDVVPEGNLIIIENRDVPGIVGNVGTLLGEEMINIAEMTWGRTAPSHDAITAINVDQEISENVLRKLRGLPNILSAKVIKM